MAKTKLARCILPFAVCIALGFSAAAQSEGYRKASIDQAGQLTITLNSGREVKPAMLHDQVAFKDAQISEDGKTVGWLADYPDPGATMYKADPIPGNLVLYRAGRILRIFPTGQIFWSWKFANNDDVAYCVGPTHGGAGECDLREIVSRRILARWFPGDENPNPPAWTQGLSY